jgi:serine phosphatase RsbU (regulator of sigma subunit)
LTVAKDSTHSWWHGHWQAIVALVVCGLITAGLAWGAASNDSSNEARLLRLEVRQAVTSLGGTISPAIQTPLLSAYELGTTEGTAGPFEKFLSSYVGPGHFTSVSLLHIGSFGPVATTTVGPVPRLLTKPALAERLLGHLSPSSTFMVVRFRAGAVTVLGYYEVPLGGNPATVIYAETILPASTRVQVASVSPYAGINFAAYLGPVRRANLFLTSTKLPNGGDTTKGTIPFGNSVISVVASASHSLEGGVATNLPLIIVIAGALLSLLAALITERLTRRRRLAERLAFENSRLYREQRTIATTLQEALLPASMPNPDGMEVAARYLPGVEGIEVGGDWYDVMEVNASEFVFVIGDVAGRGLSAATTMAELRFALRGFITQGDSPSVALGRLNDVVNFNDSGQFATVLCGHVYVDEGRVELSSAGHLPPLLMTGESIAYLTVTNAPAIGAQWDGDRLIPQESFEIPPEASLICFTDGLVERRGEGIDAGFDRLFAAASASSGTLVEMVDRMITMLAPAGPADDIAVLGFRWQPGAQK